MTTGRGRGASPDAESVKAARQAAGLTQAAAGAMVHTTRRVWARYESGDRSMHPAMWELFSLKAGAPDAEKRS